MIGRRDVKRHLKHWDMLLLQHLFLVFWYQGNLSLLIRTPVGLASGSVLSGTGWRRTRYCVLQSVSVKRGASVLHDGTRTLSGSGCHKTFPSLCPWCVNSGADWLWYAHIVPEFQKYRGQENIIWRSSIEQTGSKGMQTHCLGYHITIANIAKVRRWSTLKWKKLFVSDLWQIPKGNR